MTRTHQLRDRYQLTVEPRLAAEIAAALESGGSPIAYVVEPAAIT